MTIPFEGEIPYLCKCGNMVSPVYSYCTGCGVPAPLLKNITNLVHREDLQFTARCTETNYHTSRKAVLRMVR